MRRARIPIRVTSVIENSARFGSPITNPREKITQAISQ
jgi:hypothetical protein